jgi:hypothetical protein
MTIDDGLTQEPKVVSHALHPVTVVADGEFSLLEGVEPGVELQNTQLAVVDELSLDREPRLACGLRQLSNDLVKFEGEGVEDPGLHDVVQSSPIDGRIGDVREDVVVEGIATKHEKHKVTPPLVVGQQGFHNDRDHQLYVLEAGSLCMQVRGEGGVKVGVSIDRAIVVVILEQ